MPPTVPQPRARSAAARTAGTGRCSASTRFELDQRRAGARGDDQLARLVARRCRRSARMSSARRVGALAVEVLGAAAADAQAALRARPRCAHALDERRSGRRSSAVSEPSAARGRRAAPRLTCMRPYSAQRDSVGITLPGLSRPLRVEGALDAEHLRALGGGELHAHRVELLDADAVLAGDRCRPSRRSARGSRRRRPRRGAARRGRWRRTGSAGAGCRRRRGRRCSSAGRTSSPSPAIASSMSARRVRGIVESMHM